LTCLLSQQIPHHNSTKDPLWQQFTHPPRTIGQDD